jgi:hypothetical protein
LTNLGGSCLIEIRATALRGTLKAAFLFVAFVIVGGLISVAPVYMVDTRVLSTAGIVVLLYSVFRTPAQINITS